MTTTFLRDIWYYALPGHHLKPGQVIAKIFLNEPILLGQSQTGKVFALQDICPHQAVPLSVGNFDGHQIECAFHGWRFDEIGHCTAIPSLNKHQTFNTSRLKAQAYPVSEVQGNIWIYMSSLTMANRARSVSLDAIPQAPGFKDQTYQAAYVMPYSSDIDHAVLGLLDPAHIAFVHRAWWWRSPATLQDDVKTFEPSFLGFTMQRHPLEQQTFLYRLIGRNPEVEILFQLPGIRIEHISTPQNTVCSLTAITPISDTKTQVTTLLYTTLPWLLVLKPLALWFMYSFLAQDRRILAEQQTRLKYNPKTFLVGDADVQARWYYRLKQELILATEENRPFVNPIQAQTLRWRS